MVPNTLKFYQVDLICKFNLASTHFQPTKFFQNFKLKNLRQVLPLICNEDHSIAFQIKLQLINWI
jgi:hypothetical protein